MAGINQIFQLIFIKQKLMFELEEIFSQNNFNLSKITELDNMEIQCFLSNCRSIEDVWMQTAWGQDMKLHEDFNYVKP